MSNPSIQVRVYGSHNLRFTEGWKTGPMTESGIEVCCAKNFDDYADEFEAGGCLSREGARMLRDYLNECIYRWEQSND